MSDSLTKTCAIPGVPKPALSPEFVLLLIDAKIPFSYNSLIKSIALKSDVVFSLFIYLIYNILSD